MLRRAIPLMLSLLALAVTTVCAREYSFRSFGVSEGLNNLAVRRIFQDRSGFIWLSTENGIYRYDGDRFELFGADHGVPPNAGTAFGDAPDGSLLIGGTFGLYRLVGNRFQLLPIPFKTVEWTQGIESDGKGRTYLGTDAGLVEMSSAPGQKQFEMRVLPQPPGTSAAAAHGILVDGDVLWYGCGQQLCRKDSQGTRVFGREIGLPERDLQVIVKDGAGDLWVRARNMGIFVKPAGEARFKRPKLPASPQDIGGVPTMDGAGQILLSSVDGLLIGGHNGWQRIDRSVGLRGTVYSAYEDREHALWIGTAGRGLVQWRGYREWESYSNESGLTSDLVYEILPQDDGSLLVGTEAGLFRGERQAFGMSFKSVAGLEGFAVHSVRKSPNGDLWIGTESRGAARVDARTGKVEWFGEAQGLTLRGAYSLRFDHEHRLWVTSETGLYMAQAPYRRFSHVDALPPGRIWAVAEGTDGVVWAGGAAGLFAFADGHWKNLTAKDGLSNTEVLSLGAGPNGAMWIGYRYGGGIDRVHMQAGNVAVEKGVQRGGNDGLVYFLNSDSKGRTWAGTEKGVDMWDGAHWSHFDTNDGLAWDDCNLNAFAEQPDGTVWIGTSGGLSRFKPLQRGNSIAPLKVFFTRLEVGNKDVSGMANPSFGAHDNSLVARYSALNAPRQNGVTFRYRLGDESSSWTETTQRELHFANLAPGAYQLEVDAREEDGEWSTRSAKFPFRILTPWYLTSWFAALCVLVPLSVVAGFLRLRFLSAKQRERTLVMLVEQKTADLLRANQELSRLSLTDPLTGLGNRRAFDQALARECSRVQRTDSVLSLLFIDIDHFKLLNDSQGHQRGDDCLVTLGAEFTRLCKRQTDIPARCGGEEFAIILPGTSAADAEQFAQSVRLAIAALKVPHPASPIAPFLTVSIGVATGTRERCSTPETLQGTADLALYEAKRSGRNRVCVAHSESDPKLQAEKTA